MNSATTTSRGAGVHRPRVGMALIAALGLGGLVATGAYAQRTGVLSMSDAGLSQSAAARAQLASVLTAAPHARARHHGLLAWHAPRVPHVRVHPRVITPPPRVVTVTAPPAPPQQVSAPASAPAPAPAQAPQPKHGDDGGEGSGGGDD